MPKRDILVIGQHGQIARALAAADWPDGWTATFAGRTRLDLAEPSSIRAAFGEGEWSLVINAGAYTPVDRAEQDIEKAMAVNANGPAALAAECREHGIPLIHLSTDYVFDGAKGSPYAEDDEMRPLSVYGRSKAQGESAIRATLDRHVILRTSWVFGESGNNFVLTMLKAAAEQRPLRIVDDQRGCPTHAGAVARAILAVAPRLVGGDVDSRGTFHYCGTDSTTWFGFATAIFSRAKRSKLPFPPSLAAIRTEQYPAAARRPAYSVLLCDKIRRVFAIEPEPWQAGLDRCLAAVKRREHESSKTHA